MKHADVGMESFLQLLKPDLQAPHIEVEPESIYLSLDREETKEIKIRIRNTNRGYLFGSVELSERNDGMSLPNSNFGLDHKLKEETLLSLNIDASKMTPGRNYHTTLEITANAGNGDISVPITVGVYRNPLKTSAALWLITMPIVILAALVLHAEFSPQWFTDSFTQALGPYLVFGSGVLGTVIYNAYLTNSAKGRDNHFGNFILAIIMFFAAAAAGFIIMYVIIASVFLVVLIILAIMVLSSGNK